MVYSFYGRKVGPVSGSSFSTWGFEPPSNESMGSGNLYKTNIVYVYVCVPCWHKKSQWTHFLQIINTLFSHSLLNNIQNDVWFVGMRQQMLELHLFDGDWVSQDNFQQSQFWSQPPSNHTLISLVIITPNLGHTKSNPNIYRKTIQLFLFHKLFRTDAI